MDFWSRLIGGTSSSSSRRLRGNIAAERHIAFKHIYNALYQIWRQAPTLPRDSPAIPRIRNAVDRLNSILDDESRGPSPHPCLGYAATSQVYLTVTKLALSSLDPHIISATATLFNTLIDSEVDGIVDSRIFARALVDLVCRTASASEEGESKLVELIFGVANNIRLRPQILRAWFYPKEPSGAVDAEVKDPEKEFAGETRRDDFPLFYLLVDYVHYAGRTGDFARTGLLYIMETAARAKDLERWLIESDLATLMATGLGGSYSQLSRELPSAAAGDVEIPCIVALSDLSRLETALPPDPGSNMDAFLSYLLFWQDALDHCKSMELNDTLLDHFQVLFLQQLLYPSLLESSDVDGGSTPAVTTYLCRILESIDQPDLIHRILHFLLASPSEDEIETAKLNAQPAMSVSRRKSLDILASFAEAAAKPSPTLFNLVDLLLISIKSHNSQTVVATLRLVTVIVQRHHRFASSLIKTLPTQESEARPDRTIGALNAELQQLFGMATTIIDDPSADQSYASYLASASAFLSPRAFAINLDDHPKIPEMLQASDGILSGMLDLLSHFFANNVITNLALTSAIASLATSNLISLDGWLLVEPQHYEYSGPLDEDTVSKLTDVYKQPSWPDSEAPPLLSALQRLVQELEHWRNEIPDFDILLAARRGLLHDEDSMVLYGQPSERGRGPAPSDDPLDAGVDLASPHRGRKQSSSIARDASTSMSALRNSSAGSSISRAQSQSQSGPPPSSTDLRRRIALPLLSAESTETFNSNYASSVDNRSTDGTDHETENENGADSKEAEAEAEDVGSVTLGHLLTNAVILYEFLLELSALVQVRAGMFQEVSFTAPTT